MIKWCLCTLSKRLYNVNVGGLYEDCREVCGSIQTLQRREFTKSVAIWGKD